MKKILKIFACALLCIVMMTSLIACGGKGNEKDEPGFIDNVSLSAKLKVLGNKVDKINSDEGLLIFEAAINEVLVSYETPETNAPESNVTGDTNDVNTETDVETDVDVTSDTTEESVVDTTEVSVEESNSSNETNETETAEPSDVVADNGKNSFSNLSAEETSGSAEDVRKAKVEALKEKVKLVKTSADSDYLGDVIANITVIEKIDNADLKAKLFNVLLVYTEEEFTTFVTFVDGLVAHEAANVKDYTPAEYSWNGTYHVGYRVDYCVKRVLTFKTAESTEAVVNYTLPVVELPVEDETTEGAEA